MQILTRLNKIIAYSDNEYIPVGSTAVCAATGERYDDVLITNVDCVPTDIDAYEYHYINGKFVKGCPNSEIRETNYRKKLQFWVGKQEEYNALSEKDENIVYIVTDDNTLDNTLNSFDNRLDKVEVGVLLNSSNTPTSTVTISKAGLYAVTMETGGLANLNKVSGVISVPNLDVKTDAIFFQGDNGKGCFESCYVTYDNTKKYLECFCWAGLSGDIQRKNNAAFTDVRLLTRY